MKEQREPRCRPRKCSPSPFLAAVLLTIGAAQSAGAYEFTKPQTPTLPDNLPTQKLEVTPDTSNTPPKTPTAQAMTGTVPTGQRATTFTSPEPPIRHTSLAVGPLTVQRFRATGSLSKKRAQWARFSAGIPSRGTSSATSWKSTGQHRLRTCRESVPGRR